MPQSRQAAHDSAEQPSLFFPEATAESAAPQRAPALVQPAPLTASASIGACALPYADYLRRTDHSVYTVTCFLSDLRLLTEFLGRETPLRAISRQMLADWLVHLRMDRGTRPAPKTMSRRVTFLKNFFGWLARESVLPVDLAANITLSRPLPPLPELLFEDEVRRLEAAAAADVRCHTLVMLLLATGLKKEEVTGLRLQDVDLANPAHPPSRSTFPARPSGGASGAWNCRPRGRQSICTISSAIARGNGSSSAPIAT